MQVSVCLYYAQYDTGNKGLNCAATMASSGIGAKGDKN